LIDCNEGCVHAPPPNLQPQPTTSAVPTQSDISQTQITDG